MGKGSLEVSNKVCDKTTVYILSPPCEEKQFTCYGFRQSKPSERREKTNTSDIKKKQGNAGKAIAGK